MGNNNRLLVPMYMEALLLRNDKEDCLDISPQLDQNDQSVLGEKLQATGKKMMTLRKGIHLHWTLPKALKHAFLYKDKDEMKFPFAPNRWMVTRIQTDNGIKNMPSRTWIIESDYNNDNPDKQNLVLMKDQKLQFNNVGKSFDYHSYTSANKSFEPVLTAVGAANPFFASFYPECQNVFGFHDDLQNDDLKDIPDDCTLTYVVTGWYSNPAADPLAPLNFAGDPVTDKQIKRKRELDWFKQQWK